MVQNQAVKGLVDFDGCVLLRCVQVGGEERVGDGYVLELCRVCVVHLAGVAGYRSGEQRLDEVAAGEERMAVTAVVLRSDGPGAAAERLLECWRRVFRGMRR